MVKMNKLKRSTQRIDFGPQVTENASLHHYHAAFRRWLARELTEGRLSGTEAIARFKMSSSVVSTIKKHYAPQIVSLKDMTAAEKQQLEALQQQLKQLEKQLEEARVKNIALEALVDVAEQQFKIPIRKKPGAKQ